MGACLTQVWAERVDMIFSSDVSVALLSAVAAADDILVVIDYL